MKIIIAGGRDYVPQRKHIITINRLISEIVNKDFCNGKKTEIVCGCCNRGADVVGEMIAVMNHLETRSFPPLWNQHGKAAGPIRNEQMAKYADACILLPGDSGTANMKMNAEKYGLKIWEIR